MNVLDYSLKFRKLSKYAPFLLSNPRDEMSHFLTRVFDDFVEECHLNMLHDNMNISRLIVHAQQMEESRVRRKNREPRPPSLLKVVPQRGGWKFKISLDLRKGSPIKSLQNFPRLTMIGCLTLHL